MEPWHPTEEQQDLYYGISFHWGGIAVRLNPDAARQSMLFAVRPHRHVNPKVLSTAVDMTLACCHAAKLGGANSNATAGAGRVQNYFATVLAKKIEEVRVASFNSETAAATITEIAKIKVETEQEAKELKIKALGVSIEGNAVRRAALPGPKSPASGQRRGSEPGDRFEDEAAIEKITCGSGFTMVKGVHANMIREAVPDCTMGEVREALVEVSDRLRPTPGRLNRYPGESEAGPSIKRIIDTAITIITETRQPWWKDQVEVAKLSRDDWINLAAKHAHGRWPVGKLGPPPGDQGCLLPPGLVEMYAELYDCSGLKRPTVNRTAKDIAEEAFHAMCERARIAKDELVARAR